MVRIISKEEEREDPRRDSSIYLRVQNSVNSVVFPHFYKIPSNTVYSYKNYSVSTRNPATPSNSTYRINSSTRNTTTTRLIPCHPVHTRHLPATAPVSPSTPHGSFYSSTVLHYRILPGEIGFIPRVKYCISNTILRSVCSNLFILMLRISYKKFNSIQSSSYSMRRYSTLSSIQVVLVTILHKIH